MRELFEAINEYRVIAFCSWLAVTITICCFADLINKFKR